MLNSHIKYGCKKLTFTGYIKVTLIAKLSLDLKSVYVRVNMLKDCVSASQNQGCEMIWHISMHLSLQYIPLHWCTIIDCIPVYNISQNLQMDIINYKYLSSSDFGVVHIHFWRRMLMSVCLEVQKYANGYP